MALVIPKRCIICKHKLVQNAETQKWECKNVKCPEFVPDKVEAEPVEPNE